MSLPVFLRGVILLLVVFGLASYAIAGSAWTVFGNSMLCALLLQIGYFVAVLCMIWSRGGVVGNLDRRTSRPAAGDEGKTA